MAGLKDPEPLQESTEAIHHGPCAGVKRHGEDRIPESGVDAVDGCGGRHANMKAALHCDKKQPGIGGSG